MNRRGFFALCAGVSAAALPAVVQPAVMQPALKPWAAMTVQEREVFEENCEAAWDAARDRITAVTSYHR